MTRIPENLATTDSFRCSSRSRSRSNSIPAAVVDEEFAQPSLLSSAPGVSEIDRSKGGGPREREEAAREDEASLPEPPPPPPPPPPKVMSSFFNSSSLSSWSSEEPFKETGFFL